MSALEDFLVKEFFSEPHPSTSCAFHRQRHASLHHYDVYKNNNRQRFSIILVSVCRSMAIQAVVVVLLHLLIPLPLPEQQQKLRSHAPSEPIYLHT